MASTGLVAVQEWQWPYIVASFLVATVGSLTSLLIMRQRTSASGLRNQLYLLAGAIAFGAVGVFSMHFIGMQALHLLHPTTGQQLPITYLPLPTTISILVVVLIAVAGFGVAGDPLNQQWWRYAFGGLAGAGGVLAMHYMGMTAMCVQAEIEFDVLWVVGSVIIGVVVVSVGLLVFFRLRSYWQHNSWVLGGCSLLLGTAVCGVHYTGMQSATYWILDTPPSQLTSLPPSDVLLGLTLSLSSLSCIAALTLLALKYSLMLRAERAKLACLTINAVILDPSLHVLTTVTLGLPSVIIEPSYGGKGEFDDHNPDFLRMLKASTSFADPAPYTAFLTSLLQRRNLTPYSHTLHHRFLKAAQGLATLCQLTVPELGLLYWAPTGSSVTVVMGVEAPEAERITKTTDLRFLPPATLHPFIASLNVGNVHPEEWVQQVIDYYRKMQPAASSAVPPSPKTASPSVSTRPMSVRPTQLRLWHSSRVVPLPSPRSEAQSAVVTVGMGGEEGGGPKPPPLLTGASGGEQMVHLGLLFVKVTPAGLYVMVPGNGPYYQVPMVPLMTSPTPVTSLSAAEVDCLRDLHSSHLIAPTRPVAHQPSQPQLISHASSKGPDLSCIRAQADEDDLDLRIPPSDLPLPEQSPHTQTLHLNLDAHSRLRQSSISSGPHSALSTQNPHPRQRQPPDHRTLALNPFYSSLRSAALALASVVGSSQDLLAMNALVEGGQLVLLDEGRCCMLPLVVTQMGAGGKVAGGAEGWQDEQVRWVWLPTFEALQAKAGARVGWVRRLLKRTMARKGEREGSVVMGASQLMAGLGSSGGGMGDETSKTMFTSLHERRRSVDSVVSTREVPTSERPGEQTA